MNKIKKTFSLVLLVTILIYCIILAFLPNNVEARERTEDLTNLVNYPEIYTLVQELKTAHPNWTFTALYTGLDWNTVLYNETTAKHFRSVVHKTYTTDNVGDWVCPTCKMSDGSPILYESQWYCASNKTVSYYIDPRNWLNETYIFAFETLSFNEAVHTVQGVKSILSGTNMDTDTITYIDTTGNTQVINKSFAQVIYEAGKKNNVSPYHLAARIIQEQGRNGSSTTSGNYTYTNAQGNTTQYLGYYNYFNIGATAPSGSPIAEVIKNGLEKAKEKGWTNPELSIVGGAYFLSGEYINGYQDCLYLEKFSVDEASKCLYWHQYQQNLSAPYTESTTIQREYNNLGILENNFNFIIPIYNNMPTTASIKPGRKISLHTENVVVNTLYYPLTVRSGPSTNYGIKGKVPKGTTIVRIERAEEISSDGRYWDKIFYNAGSEAIIGYASREYLGEIATAETLNEAKTIGVMCNLRNGPGTTNTRVKQILPVGTQVTIIDKINYKIDGLVWCRVKLSDGTQGYVAENFFQAGPVEKYKIDGENIIIAPNTAITDIPKATLVGDVLGTGAKVKVEDKEYILVVKGDCNGDGVIDSADLLKVVKHLKNLSKVQIEKAADTNNDGIIDSADLLKIVKHLKGLSLISI